MKKNVTFFKILLILLVFFIGIGYFEYNYIADMSYALNPQGLFLIDILTYCTIGFIIGIKDFPLTFTKKLNIINIILMIALMIGVIILLFYPIFTPYISVTIISYLLNISAYKLFSFLLGYTAYHTFFKTE